MAYAAATDVSSDRTRAEIEKLLQRYGAERFSYGWDQEKALIGFSMNGRHIRFKVTMPAKSDPRFTQTPSRKWRRSEQQALVAWEQGCRQKWRALALVIKAKLEAVEAGITTFEDEFLSVTLLPSGDTVGQWIQPQIELAYKGGEMPAGLLEEAKR